MDKIVMLAEIDVLRAKVAKLQALAAACRAAMASQQAAPSTIEYDRDGNRRREWYDLAKEHSDAIKAALADIPD